MFYSQYVLTKKGPLAKIWLAAHMQNKLTKAMVFATDVRKAVDKIIRPDAPMALRLTSNLLLGVVRIFSRKAKYLLQESSEAMTKMKQTFRPGASTALDLPADEENANFNAVTLDAKGDYLSTRAPLLDLDLLPRPSSQRRSIDRSHTSSFVAAERDITIDEFAGGLSGGMIDAFALDPEIHRAGSSLGEMELTQEEPLLFTPSQRTPVRSASPAVASVLSAPGSVEVLRDAGEEEAPVPMPVTPILAEEPPAKEPEVTAEAIPPIEPTSPPPYQEAPPMPEEPLEVSPPVERPSIEPTQLETPGDARLSIGGDELVLMEDVEEPPPVQEPIAEEPAPEAVAEEAVPEPSQVVRGRKRKAFMRIDEDKTELTAAEFRACLNDTSDLIRRPRIRRRLSPEERRQQARGVPLRPEDILARPVISMPPELNAMFAEWFAADAMLHRIASPMSEPGREAEQLEEREREKAQLEEEIAEVPAVPPPEEPPAIEPIAEEPVPAPAAEAAAVAEPQPTPVPTRKSDEVSSDGGAVSARLSGIGEMPSPPRYSEEFVPPPPMEELQPEPLAFEPPAGQPSREPTEIPEELPPAAEEVPFEPKTTISLHDVARARVQVARVDVPEGEEALAEEGVEPTESDILSERAIKMHQFLRENLDEEGIVNFTDALSREDKMTRRTAARTFYEMLNLCSRKIVTLEQAEAYGTILAKPLQPGFDAVREQIPSA